MRAAAYLRVSTEDQAKMGISLQAQLESIVHYCKSKDWELVQTYTDDGYSSKNLQRPGMKQLLHDVKRNRFDVVIAWKLDRLTRKLFDLLYLVEYFTKNNISMSSVQDSIDTGSKEGMLLLHILGSLAEWERETIIERTKEAAAYIARHGRWHGGPAPFAYTYIPKSGEQSGRLVPVPEQAATVRLIFDLCTKRHFGVLKIANYLNGDNPSLKKFPTPSVAEEWTTALVSRVLHNPVYAGWIVHYTNRRLKIKEVYEGKHEPIVDRDQWNEAQSILKTRREGQREKRSYLLSGILRCGVCGAKMRAKQQWSNWPREPKKYIHSYICYTRAHPNHYLARGSCTAPHHSGKKLENTVLEEISRYLRHPELMEQVFREKSSMVQTPAGPTTRPAIQEELADINERLNRWAELMETGKIDIAAFQDRVYVLQERRRQLEMQLDSQEVAVASDNLTVQRIAVFRQIMDQAAGSLEKTYPAEQTWTALRMLVKEIYVAADGSIQSITWR